jgi:carboxylesterase
MGASAAVVEEVTTVPVLDGAEPFLLDAGAGVGDAAGGRTRAGGARAGVVLCHGFTGTPQSMRPWGEHLHAAGLTVHCPRLPGHGTRWQDLNATRWEDWYSEVDRALDAMLGRVPTVFAMGLSMGGTLAIRLAEQRGDDLAGLALVNPSLTSLRPEVRLLPVLARFVPSVRGVANDINKPGATELAYDRTPLKAAASLQRLWRVTTEDLAKVTVPVKVFRSATDHVVEPVSAEMLLERVSSTDTDEVVLPDSYHVATLDNDAEVIFTGSVAFVDRILSAGQEVPG